jgi:hypothetical protein
MPTMLLLQLLLLLTMMLPLLTMLLLLLLLMLPLQITMMSAAVLKFEPRNEGVSLMMELDRLCCVLRKE